MSGIPDTDVLMVRRTWSRVQQKARTSGGGGQSYSDLAKSERLDSDRYGSFFGLKSRPHFRYWMRQARGWLDYAPNHRKGLTYDHVRTAERPMNQAAPRLVCFWMHNARLGA